MGEDKGRSLLFGFDRTDIGNARRLVHRHGKDIRYVTAWRTWLAWDRTRWVREGRASVRALAMNTAEAITGEVAVLIKIAEGALEKSLKEYISFGRLSQSAGRINAMIDLAQSLPDVLIEPHQLDADPYLFNVINGTLNLKTGRLLQHRREDFITKIAPIVYDATERAPRFVKFIKEIFAPHPELVDYVQKILGYSLTGDTREAVLPIFYGSGRNGKTTLLERVLKLVGDYGAQTGVTTFALKSDGAIPNDLAALAGKRFVVTSEASRETRLNESLIKQMTGGTTLSARFMRQEFFSFSPMFKCFIDTNHLPRARIDEALAARLAIIPFDVSFYGREDKNLPAKLEAEGPGILNWMLEGCLRFQRDGLGRPPIILHTLYNYERVQNPVLEFVETECECHETYTTSAQQLFNAYEAWCRARHDIYRLSWTSFGERIAKIPGVKRRGLKLMVGGKQREVTAYDGIKLLATPNLKRKFPVPPSGGI